MESFPNFTNLMEVEDGGGWNIVDNSYNIMIDDALIVRNIYIGPRIVYSVKHNKVFLL